jgi:hypothetical protein
LAWLGQGALRFPGSVPTLTIGERFADERGGMM